jgi:hypothetical protein
MNSLKCAQCGLVNFATSTACRRCSAELTSEAPEFEYTPQVQPPMYAGRGLASWLLWIAGVTVMILVACYVSLLASSDGLSTEERQLVMSAIKELDRAGFSRESFALRRLVSYRSTDNWWNRYVGHQTAYAATNYPFGVVTLYPAFFKFPVDDVERATILLHEAYHVFGEAEKTALQKVWIGKQKLGWTSLSYSHTRVWKNTREWTAGGVPLLFRCGLDGQSDCLE